MKALNDRKICFIICSSNERYTAECLYYIKHLHVPEGCEIETRIVKDAVSMTAGYNEGMQASDAKYKVYLHQDVFIINRFFIKDFLEIFESDEQIGMIGMVGSPKLPESGVMWEGERCGAIYVPAYFVDSLARFGGDTLTEVEAIDGLMMITQYDLPWREDLFDKWHFYDCSQSFEFRRRGYKVVVPYVETPWCLHDSSLADLTEYEGERLKFLREYSARPEDAKGQTKKNITVILTTYNRLQTLQDTLQWLQDVSGIANLIVLDNGSRDGTGEWLSEQGYDYILFDEGVTGYGRLWNAALTNFETEECIVFMEAGTYPEKESLAELARALRTEKTGIASPVTTHFSEDEDRSIMHRESFTALRQNFCRQRKDGGADHKALCANWKMWAVRRRLLDEIGLFREELQHPEEVLTDYSLRMMINQWEQIVCGRTFLCESFVMCSEIYREADLWQLQDREFMKNEWEMNYFNLRPNSYLVNAVHAKEGTPFSVLEVGCDLGATLYEMQTRYPECKAYGIDINEAAINIAKHIVEAEYGNIDELSIPFEEKFDYIIFGDVLEHLRRPEEVIVFCREHLKENGHIIACIPNVMHVSVMEELIDGRFHYEDQGLLDRTHIHLFTYYEIMHMFVNAGYTVEEIQEKSFAVSERQERIISALLALSDQTEDWMYRTFQYIVKARK